MLASIWAFLQDGSNQAVLGWIGGGIVVVVGGIWAVFKFVAAQTKTSPPAPTVSASNGGVAAGHDIRDTKIDTRGSSWR
jgi:hypothetical protein